MSVALGAVIILAFAGAWLRRTYGTPWWQVAAAAMGLVVIITLVQPLWILASIFAAVGVYFLADVLVPDRGEQPVPIESTPDTRWAEVEKFAAEEDPWLAIREHRTTERREQLPIGMGRHGWTDTKRQSNCLILGPPRSGKTTAVAVPQILTAFAPVVAVTTKGATLYGPTAQTRARMGRATRGRSR